MHLLTRICIQNWYLIDAIDIEVKGATALVGPTGAGKSSIQDAIQTVIKGANHNRMTLNPSASGRSQRSILEYCLGMTGDAAEGGKPLRSSCESLIALVFRDEETDEPVTVGIAMSARIGDSREEILSRFIAPGFAYSVEMSKRRLGTKEMLTPWAETLDLIKAQCPGLEEYRSSAEKFTGEMLRHMRRDGQVPNPKHFLRAFSNALAFKPIFDPTLFVREFILEPDALDIDRVRTSIATWQELERVIEDIEAKLRRVTRLSERFRTWGRAKVRAEAARFRSVSAEFRRLALEVGQLRDQRKSKSERLATEFSALATRKQWIREIEDEIRTKQALIQASSEGVLTRQIEIEKQHIERGLKEAEVRYAKLKQAFSMIASLSAVRNHFKVHEERIVDAAKEAFNLMSDLGHPADAIKGRGERIQALFDEIQGFSGLEHVLQERLQDFMTEAKQLQSEVDGFSTQVQGGSGQGNAILSPQASRLLQMLDRQGMSPVPLCDVVEVIDPEWQFAVESLLGRAREAIIVPPEKVLKAFDLMYQDRDTYVGCTLVKTNATPRVRFQVPRGSILEAITTENDHAAAFLSVRIGGYQKADTEAELTSLDRGVMKNGKSTSGMGLSVTQSVKDLMLSRAARDKASESLRYDLDQKLALLLRRNEQIALLREAVRTFISAMLILSDGENPFYLEYSLVNAQTQMSKLLDQERTAMDGDAARLTQEIADLESDRQLYVNGIAEDIEPEIQQLQKAVAVAEARLESAVEQMRKAYRDRKKAWDALYAADLQKLLQLDPEIDEPGAIRLLRAMRDEFRRQEADRTDRKAWLASVKADARVIADNYESEVRREQSGAIREMAEYAASWGAGVPQVDHETMTVGYVWVMGERARLEGNELRKHRQACEKAAQEVRKLLKEDLLARLSEKLVKVHYKLDTLNGLLAKHRFTGQTYTFTFSVNQRFQKMHDLAMKVGSGMDGTSVSLEADEVAEAVAELESLIHGQEGTEQLADYREYFTFEIVMTNSAGLKTSMSTRAVKGSGGEAQAPFYVAIAASLASAYFPGHAHGTPTGMGLALFDEAFNKLDVPNTQALLTFFRDMGLQLLIAGPEDKRATFTEVLETIILVNKALDGSSVYVDAEYPGEMARLALGGINPDHGGVDQFRIN